MVTALKTDIKADLELVSLWEVVNGLSGFDLDKEDITDEVINRATVLLRLHQLEKLLELKGVAPAPTIKDYERKF